MNVDNYANKLLTNRRFHDKRLNFLNTVEVPWIRSASGRPERVSCKMHYFETSQDHCFGRFSFNRGPVGPNPFLERANFEWLYLFVYPWISHPAVGRRCAKAAGERRRDILRTDERASTLIPKPVWRDAWRHANFIIFSCLGLHY